MNKMSSGLIFFNILEAFLKSSSSLSEKEEIITTLRSTIEEQFEKS